MALVAMLLLAWCLLSLPVGIIVGKSLRKPHAQSACERRTAGSSSTIGAPRPPVAA